jgi:hypothetical protein
MMKTAHFKKFLSSAKTSAAENGPDLDIFGPRQNDTFSPGKERERPGN